jgi:CelD/BcsL family acetyltransferase involved in cellulose biosynthesis
MAYSLSAAGEMAGIRTQALEGAPASATLGLVTSIEALRNMEAQWRDLEASTQSHTGVFQSFDWIMAWSETYIGRQDQNSLHILAGYDDGELIFLWPLMRGKRFGLSFLTWVTDPFGQYGDILCRKGHCPKQWIKGSVSFLKRLNDIDLLHLRHVRADSHIQPQAAEFLCNARVPEQAPFLDLTQYADEDAYDARYTSAQRKRRKKIRKGLEQLGAVTFTRLPAGTLADAAMKQAIDEKNLWLAKRGRINRVMGCPGHLAFLKNLSRRLRGSVEVVVTEMKTGDRPVSWEVGFRHKGMHHGYITSHVTTLTDYSPGRLHMDLSQRTALNDGMTAFDLMVPNDSHKESWSSGKTDTNDYYLPLSVVGAAYGHGYIRTLRPLLRSVYYKLENAGLGKHNIFARIGTNASRET